MIGLKTDMEVGLVLRGADLVGLYVGEYEAEVEEVCSDNLEKVSRAF